MDNYVKNDAALLGGRGAGWNLDTGEEEIKAEEGSLSPDLSMLIITVSPRLADLSTWVGGAQETFVSSS